MAAHEQCPFCDSSETPASPFDVRLPLQERAALIPALGMLMPGYLLAVTDEHTTSFAQLDRVRLRNTDNALQKSEQYLQKHFGAYVRVEHGSDNITACGSGGCIEHAHQHLIPDLRVGELIHKKLPWQQLDSYEDIAEFRGKPYIYLGRLGLHYVVPEPQLPGQWTRRQIAEVWGLDHWDWALSQGALNLLKTFVELNVFPEKKLLVDIANDSIAFAES